MNQNKNIGDEMKNFKFLVDCVEDNFEVNEGRWNTWKDAKHIQEVYGSLEDEYKETAELFLNKLIECDGFYVRQFLDAWKIIEYGIL